MIGVIGNAAIDLIYRVAALPRAGETVLTTAHDLDVGGKGLNQAVMSRRAGSPVRFAAIVGTDANGETITQQMACEDIPGEDLIMRGRSSDHSIIQVDPLGNNCIVSKVDRAASMSVADSEPLLDVLDAGDCLLMQGNLSADLTRTCLARAHAKRVRTIVNPAPITYDYAPLWPWIDLVIVNQVEGRDLTGHREPAAITETLCGFGIENAIVTLGMNGALLRRGDQVFSIKAPGVTAIDTTGAGDVFCGVIAAALDQGMTPEMACRWAVAAASLSVTKPGTLRSFPNAEELQSVRPR